MEVMFYVSWAEPISRCMWIIKVTVIRTKSSWISWGKLLTQSTSAITEINKYTPGESGLVSREAKDSALLSSRTGYFLDPTEWPKGSQSSCEVWREDQGLLSRSGRKRRPPSLLDGGILWFFSNCGATVGFLTRYDGVLREPLVWY